MARNIDHGSKPLPTDLFKFDVDVWYHSDHRRYERFYHHDIPTIDCKSFFSQEGQDYLWRHLSTDPHVPSDWLDYIVAQVTYGVQQMYNIDFEPQVKVLPSRSRPRVFPVFCEMELELPNDQHDDGELVMEESTQQVGMIPASKDAIELLKTFDHFKVTTHVRECCVICMDEFDVNDDSDDDMVMCICTMPCNHAFHQQCIVRWLQTSHMCPLCLYSMPTINDLKIDPND